MCSWCSSMWGGGMMILWVLVAAAIVWFFWMWSRGAWTRGTPPDEGRDAAEQVLRERFARGEIDDATFQRMLAELHAH